MLIAESAGFSRGEYVKVVSVNTINGVKVPLQYTKGEHAAGDGGAVAVFAAVSIVGGIL